MSHSTVSLPTARAHQLRELAQYFEVPAIDLLDQFIAGCWEDAGFEDLLPPFEIIVSPDDATGAPRVFFSAPGADILDLAPADAHAVSRGLLSLLAGTASRFVVPAQCGGRPGGLVGARWGRGFVLRIAGDLDGAPRAAVVSLTASVARDLARILAARAEQATGARS